MQLARVLRAPSVVPSRAAPIVVAIGDTRVDVRAGVERAPLSEVFEAPMAASARVRL